MSAAISTQYPYNSKFPDQKMVAKEVSYDVPFDSDAVIIGIAIAVFALAIVSGVVLIAVGIGTAPWNPSAGLITGIGVGILFATVKGGCLAALALAGR